LLALRLAVGLHELSFEVAEVLNQHAGGSKTDDWSDKWGLTAASACLQSHKVSLQLLVCGTLSTDVGTLVAPGEGRQQPKS
jgi:hypothetical protein